MTLNLKDLREINKLTQKELAEKIGSTRKSIIRYETGERIPSIATAKRLSIALDVSLDDLINGMLTAYDEDRL